MQSANPFTDDKNNGWVTNIVKTILFPVDLTFSLF